MHIWSIVLACGIPSGIVSLIVGIFAYKINRKMDDDRKAREEQERARKQFETFQIKALTATMALCEANATALQNGRCNGETHAALRYMQKIKHEQRDFLTSQGIEHLF